MNREEALTGAIGIFGGAFNPVHNGHLRMAIETREALNLRRVDFMPTHIPPHKSTQGLLPFELRLGLLLESVSNIDGLGVNALEAEMPGPSYSFETMSRLHAAEPDSRFAFVMGSTDFVTLPDWHRGLDLPLITDIVVADRTGTNLPAVDEFLTHHWEWSEEGPNIRRIAGGRLVVFIAIPRLDISATLVRDKFIRGQDPLALVPDAVRRRMRAEPHLFHHFWTR